MCYSRLMFGVAMSKKNLKALLIIAAACLLSGCVLALPLVEKIENSAQEPVQSLLPQASLTCVTCAAKVEPVSQTKRIVRRRYSRVQRLVKRLGSRSEIERTYAAGDLGLLGSKARSAVEPLISCLGDKSKHVRRASAKSLGKIRSKRAIHPLIKSLRDRDRYVAYSAARALQKIGTPEAIRAVNSNRTYWSL